MSISPIAYLEYNLKIIRRTIEKYCRERIDIYLDLGAGNCQLTSYIASLVNPKEVIVIDIDEETLRIALRKGFKAFRINLNIDELPLENNSVDLVTAFEVLEHLWNKDKVLEEVYRVLRPEGLFIVSTPNLVSLINRFLILLGQLPLHYNVSLKYEVEKPSYGHISLYTADSLRKHLSVIGFEVLETAGMLTHYAYKNVAIKAIMITLSRLRPSLAPDILIVAKKRKL